MHAIDLAELASTFVRTCTPLTELQLPPCRSAAQDMWLTARYRQENWLHRLAHHRDSICRPGTSRRVRLWADVMPVIQEVLLAEPLSRVVAYAASVWESRGIDGELAPLASSMLAAHIEARNRCLHLIVFGQGLAVENAVCVNRMRRSLELYTDQLLGWLPSIDNPGLYAFEPKNTERQQSNRRSLERPSHWLTLQTMFHWEHLWQAIYYDVDFRAESARLNHRLSQHVLGLFPNGCFDGLGVPHSPGGMRLRRPSLEGEVGPHTLHPLFDNALQPTSEKKRLQLLPKSPRFENE